MNRFRSTFGDLRPARRKFLSVFLTAGYPSSEMTVRLAAGVVEAGADVIEIGIPFSDPLADGPVIQRSSHQALAMHMTPAGVFSMVAEIRKSTGVPIILMGYVNPIFSRGMAAFMNDAMISGVDGMIIPDLPIEESAGYRQSAAKSGIAAVFMITPTTPDHRIVEIDRLSGGFVYAVTVNGVTGQHTETDGSALGFVTRARKQVRRNPLLAGFGISNPATAAKMAGLCDGVIVGSAVMNRLRATNPEDGYRSAVDFVSSIRSALD